MYYTEKIRFKIDWRLERIAYLRALLRRLSVAVLYEDAEKELLSENDFCCEFEIYAEIRAREKAIQRLYKRLRPENPLFPDE